MTGSCYTPGTEDGWDAHPPGPLRTSHAKQVGSDRQQTGGDQGRGWIGDAGCVAVAAGRVVVHPSKPVREMVGVREATGAGDGGDRQVALGEQRGRSGEPQQLERGHRADAEPAPKDAAQMARRDLRQRRAHRGRGAWRRRTEPRPGRRARPRIPRQAVRWPSRRSQPTGKEHDDEPDELRRDVTVGV